MAKKGSILTCGAIVGWLSAVRAEVEFTVGRGCENTDGGVQWLVISVFPGRDFFTIFWEIMQNLYPKVASFQ